MPWRGSRSVHRSSSGCSFRSWARGSSRTAPSRCRAAGGRRVVNNRTAALFLSECTVEPRPRHPVTHEPRSPVDGVRSLVSFRSRWSRWPPSPCRRPVQLHLFGQLDRPLPGPDPDSSTNAESARLTPDLSFNKSRRRDCDSDGRRPSLSPRAARPAGHRTHEERRGPSVEAIVQVQLSGLLWERGGHSIPRRPVRRAPVTTMLGWIRRSKAWPFRPGRGVHLLVHHSDGRRDRGEQAGSPTAGLIAPTSPSLPLTNEQATPSRLIGSFAASTLLAGAAGPPLCPPSPAD